MLLIIICLTMQKHIDRSTFSEIISIEEHMHSKHYKETLPELYLLHCGQSSVEIYDMNLVDFITGDLNRPTVDKKQTVQKYTFQICYVWLGLFQTIRALCNRLDVTL